MNGAYRKGIPIPRANLEAVVHALPEKPEYPIAENGHGLSGGQKQRLSLARALLSRPPFLILDEVSANLDDETESEIAEAILNLKGTWTVVIVSHRPGILKYADRIVALDTSTVKARETQTVSEKLFFGEIAFE